MATAPRILVVEDDHRTAALLELYLEEAGYRVSVEHDGRSGLQRARELRPQLVVLDLMMPGLDGWSVCRELRVDSEVPILILSARQEEDDRLVGLKLGADDYVVKPFSPREVVLRVQAILRRCGGSPEPEAGTDFMLRVDPERRCAFSNGLEISLTPSEYTLLETLTSAPGRTFERSELLDRLYPRGGCVVPKVVDVHIGKLRRKVEPDPGKPRHIVTVRGFGYRFEGAR